MARVTLDWIQLAVVVGALQGLLLTAVLFAQRSNRTANRLLGALMGAFTIYLASAVYYAAGIVRAYPQFCGLSFPMLYLRRHRRAIEENYSNVARVNLTWLLWLAGAAATIWVLATTTQVTDFNRQLRDEHISLSIAVVVYAIDAVGFPRDGRRT